VKTDVCDKLTAKTDILRQPYSEPGNHVHHIHPLSLYSIGRRRRTTWQPTRTKNLKVRIFQKRR